MEKHIQDMELSTHVVTNTSIAFLVGYARGWIVEHQDSYIWRILIHEAEDEDGKDTYRLLIYYREPEADDGSD